MSSLFLIGYRGTGKSTVGRRAAELLDCDFVDADQEIQQRAGRTIREIFDTEGEAAFRDLESQVFADLAMLHQIIVALGGGAVMREANRELLAGHVTVWLKADPETVHGRIQSDRLSRVQRPNLTSQGGLEEIRRLIEQRRPIYETCADYSIDTGHCPADQVAEQIVSLGRKLWAPPGG